MLKRHMAMCLLATTLGAAPALAQSTSGTSAAGTSSTGTTMTTKGSPTNPSASMSDKSGMSKPDANNSSMNSGMNNTGASAGGSMKSTNSAATSAQTAKPMNSPSVTTTTGTMSTSSAASASVNKPANAKPLAAPGPGQVLGSDLEGTRVYGANNENIGDISDTLIDRNGQVVAVIVGVGGFLGIGEKDVAIPFSALEIVPQDATAASGNMASTTVNAPATAGKTTSGASTTKANESDKGTIEPTKIILRGMTKADLEKAPAFDADADVDEDNAAGASTTR